MFHLQYPFSPPPPLMPPWELQQGEEELMEFCNSKEFDALPFFSEPDSVLDLGAHISPLSSPCSDNSSSIFTCYSPSRLSLSSDVQTWPPEEYTTLQDDPPPPLHELGFTFDNVSSPTASSSVSSDLSHQSEAQQQELDLLEDLLLDVDSSVNSDTNNNNSIAEKGVEIVHLLLACVENIQEGNTSASTLILDHLASSTPNAVVGSPLERVSTYIATALRERINKSALFDSARNDRSSTEQSHLGHAQRVFYQHFPFLKFAHFTANRAILESVKDQPRIHVVDLDIGEGLQWPNFIQVLATSSEEVTPALRITGVGSNLGELQTTGKRLAEFANLVGLESFEYRCMVVSSPEQVSSLEFCIREEGEALAVNCSMFLHRLLGNQPALERTLCMIRSWGPRVVALTEVEANHDTSSFVDRFVESLHFYSALFDCVEAALPRTDSERLCMESFLFGEEINNILACEGADRIVRHARSEKWRECMRWSGFKEVPLSDQGLYQAHIFLSLYPPAYTLSRDGQALILGWHDTPVVSVSTWSCY